MNLDELFCEKELIEWTQKLISIPSHTALPGREREIAGFLAQLLEQEGIECRLQPADGDRCNVIATLHGDGSGPSLMLNGHMDTVPVEGMDDPFGAQIRDGILYGRGAADMKSGLAAMLYAFVLVHRSGLPLRGDVVFAGVIDEEAAKSTGSRVIAQPGPHTDFAIVGEPTALFPVIAHNGIDYFEIRFHGKSAHSSRPENGANAIYAAADFARYIRDVLAPLYKSKVHPLVGSAAINAGLIQGCAHINRGFLLGTDETFAGVVPDETSLFVDVRWTPDQTIEEVTLQLEQAAEQVRSANPGVDVQVHYIPLPRPAMEISAESCLVKSMVKNISALSPQTAQPQGVTYFADSGILSGVGKIASMIFGPGDIAVAHSPGECVEVEQICKAARIYAQTIVDVCCHSSRNTKGENHER